MEKLEGFEVKRKEGTVCKLWKTLYGLKQTPRKWYIKFESFMTKQEHRKTSSDYCVFMQKFGTGDFIVPLLYVDDMLIVGHNMPKISELKRDLARSFGIKDLSRAKQILGIHITRDNSQGKLCLFS